MEIKITKRQILDKCNGSAYSDAYTIYLVHGKIINDKKTYFRPYRFVFRVWKDDIFAWDEYPERMSIKRQNEIRDEMMQGVFDLIKSYDDCEDFIDYCIESIEKYNQRISA